MEQKCKYCGAKISKTYKDRCNNCAHKESRVKELIAVCGRVKELALKREMERRVQESYHRH